MVSRRSWSTRTAVVILGTLCVGAGCSDSSDDSNTPSADGPVQTSTTGVSPQRRDTAGGIGLAVPQSWQPVPSAQRRGAVSWAARRRHGGDDVAEIAVFADVRQLDDAKTAASSLESSQRFVTKDFEETATEPIDVPGSDDAYRIDYTYEAIDKQGQPTGDTVNGSDITVTRQLHHQTLVRITALDHELDADTITSVVDSITMNDSPSASR